MRYLAFATDYDGTLADEGVVSARVIGLLRELRKSGRKLLLVTGRELPDLARVFPQFEIFDRIVAENGALLYRPSTKSETLLAPEADQALVAELRHRHVAPLAVGRCIIATREPFETQVIEAIRGLGLELHVIFNKGAVMILPSGINKSTGFRAALGELGLSSHDVVGAGDGENDHAFLNECGLATAVNNAVTALKADADVVLKNQGSSGVEALIEDLLRDDLAELSQHSRKHWISLGTVASELEPERTFRIPARDFRILIAGPSGSGKTTVTTAVLERIAESGHQFCVIDPEGDYEEFPNSVRLGDVHHVPSYDEVMQLIEHFENVAVNLLAIPLMDRPKYFAGLLAMLQQARMASGRPHWLVLDEAHHLLPTNWQPASLTVPKEFGACIFVTVHPDKVSPEALAAIDLVLAIGENPAETIERFAEKNQMSADLSSSWPPEWRRQNQKKFEVTAWLVHSGKHPFRLHLQPGKVEHDRQRRKYAQGDLEEDSFVFTGANGKMRLRAQNLMMFAQIAEGIDIETWRFHLARHDYSAWLRKAVQNEPLATEIERLETNLAQNAEKARHEIIKTISEAYTSAA